MWSRSALCDSLDLERVIIQAPMAGSTTPQLAAAVSNAGGLGSLGLGTTPVEQADQQIVAFKSLSNRSLNVNFFCHADPGDLAGVGAEMRARLQPYYDANGLGEVPFPSSPFPSFGPAHLDLIRSHRPQVVSFHFGLPSDDLLRAVKETGAVVMSSATTVDEARWLEARGVDAVIAQGLEAGGHRATFLGTVPSSQAGLFALLPQVARAVRLPVVAAGGISNGQGIAAALLLGATGVQLGTAFLRCPEAAVGPAYRAALASASDIGTRVTRLLSGRPNRVMHNRLTEGLRDAEDLVVPYPAQLALTGPLWSTGMTDFLAFLAEVAPQVAAGKIKYREDIRQGLENVPTCFGEMLRGDNFGKMLVQVAPDPTL